MVVDLTVFLPLLSLVRYVLILLAEVILPIDGSVVLRERQDAGKAPESHILIKLIYKGYVFVVLLERQILFK